MSVKSFETKEKLTLELDNGDRTKLEQAFTEWNFKDYQSFLRFVVSAMLLTTDKSLTITTDNGNEKIVPRDDVLKK